MEVSHDRRFRSQRIIGNSHGYRCEARRTNSASHSITGSGNTAKHKDLDQKRRKGQISDIVGHGAGADGESTNMHDIESDVG